MYRFNVIGAAMAACYGLQSAFSYWLVPVILQLRNHPGDATFYQRLTGLSAPSFLLSNKAFLVVYCGPLLFATILLCIALLTLSKVEMTRKTLDGLFRWAVVFGVLCLPALPVVAQDFWLSARWGNMVTSGLNPYYLPVPADMAGYWPPTEDSMRMTYGPLWAVVSAMVMFLAWTPWMTFVLFKLVLGSAWLGSLILVRRLTERLDLQTQCAAMMVSGWMPVGVGQIVGEGHNDILMAMFVLLWLTNPAAPLSLVCGILCKYSVAPLALIDWLGNRSVRRWIVPAVFGVGVMALFFRGPGFFSTAASMETWPNWLTPQAAVRALGRGAQLSVALVVTLSAVPFVVGWLLTKTEERWRQAVVATLVATTFGLIGHFWPWYLTWTLLPAALLPFWWMSRLVQGIGLAAPFSVLYITVGEPVHWLNDLPSVLQFATGFAWMLATWRVGPSFTQRPDAPREAIIGRS